MCSRRYKRIIPMQKAECHRPLTLLYCTPAKRRGKGAGKWIYIALLSIRRSHRALRCESHSFSCKLHRTCLYRVSVHQTAPPKSVRTLVIPRRRPLQPFALVMARSHNVINEYATTVSCDCLVSSYRPYYYTVSGKTVQTVFWPQLL